MISDLEAERMKQRKKAVYDIFTFASQRDTNGYTEPMLLTILFYLQAIALPVVLYNTSPDKEFATAKVATATYIDLLLLTALVPAFGLAALFASHEGIQEFERIVLPISGILSVAHIVLLIMIQVYIFNVEKDIVDGIVKIEDHKIGWPQLYKALLNLVIGFYVYVGVVMVANVLSCVYGIFMQTKAIAKEADKPKERSMDTIKYIQAEC